VLIQGETFPTTSVFQSWLGRSKSDLVNGRLLKQTGLIYSRLNLGWAIGRQMKWNLNVKFVNNGIWSFRPATVSSPTVSSRNRFVPYRFVPFLIAWFRVQLHIIYTIEFFKASKLHELEERVLF
jgi:hypothetical protein